MKHKCPYLDAQNRCTHKLNNLKPGKKLTNCPFNNPIKCQMYNLWEKEQKCDQEALKWLRDTIRMEEDDGKE